MKKLFTLIAAALMAVSVNAAKSEISLTGWGWGWSSEVTNTDGNLVVNVTSNNGAGSTGWSDGTDWSSYTRLVAVVESATIPEGGYGQIQAKYKDAEGNDAYISGGITSSTTQQIVTVNFEDPSALTKVVQLWFQGSEGASFTISSVYLENDEAEPTTVAIDLSTIGSKDDSGNTFAANGDGTYTLTAVAAWGWNNIYYGGFDASDYDFLAVELAEATDVNFQICINYTETVDDGANVWLNAGETSGQATLSAKGKSSISQIALQTSGAGTVKIKSIYWGKNATDGIKSLSVENADVVKSEYFNVAGQKVASPKGLTIVKQTLSNGKTVSKKVVMN